MVSPDRKFRIQFADSLIRIGHVFQGYVLVTIGSEQGFVCCSFNLLLKINNFNLEVFNRSIVFSFGKFHNSLLFMNCIFLFFNRERILVLSCTQGPSYPRKWGYIGEYKGTFPLSLLPFPLFLVVNCRSIRMNDKDIGALW